MQRKAVNYLLIYAVLMSVWFVAQQHLMSCGLTSSQVMSLSGASMFGLIVLSWVRFRKLPQRKSVKWLVASVISGIFIAECLISATEKYGAELGANSMGLAPVFAVFIGMALLKERPGILGIFGILIVVGGIYALHMKTDLTGGLIAPLQSMWGPWLWYTLVLGLAAGLGLVVGKPCVILTDPLMAPGIQLFLGFGVYGVVRGLVTNELLALNLRLGLMELLLLVLLFMSFGIANWAQAELYRYTAAASVGALKRLYTPLTVLLAWIVFGQQANLFPLLIGSILVFIGALAITADKPKEFPK